MERIVYINGEYVDEIDAKVSVFDRGFLFSDAVYEVTAVIEKKLVSWQGHLRRLKRSLAEISKKVTQFIKRLDLQYEYGSRWIEMEQDVFYL